MPTHFRELIIWQESIRFAVEVYKVTADFPKEEIYSLTRQTRRSAVSVPGNIAEGVSRQTKKDKVRYLVIARGSVEETRSHLSMALELNYIDDKVFRKVDSDYELLAKKINAFIRNIR